MAFVQAATQTLNIASASTVAVLKTVNILNGATPASTSALTLNVMAGLPAGASIIHVISLGVLMHMEQKTLMYLTGI